MKESNAVLTPEEYAACDGTALAGLEARGEVTLAEMTASARVAIHRVNPTLRAVIEIYQDRFATRKTAWAPARCGVFRSFPRSARPVTGLGPSTNRTSASGCA